MKKLTSILLIGLLCLGNSWAGSFSAGVNDSTARANAATAQSSAAAAQSTANTAVTALQNQTGVIFQFAGSSCPAGTLEINITATTVSRTTYANLYSAIGTTWGAGDGSTTFNIPVILADQVAVQANGNVGTTTVGQVINHTHPQSGQTLAGLTGGTVGLTTSTDLFNSANTGNPSTGGDYNLAAGVRVLNCIKY